MKGWVIAKERAIDEVYWTGGLNGHGTSVLLTDAYHFSTYTAALECTGTHFELRDSEEWRIVPADRSRSLVRG